MKHVLKEALRRSLKGAGHRFVGHMLFCLLFGAVLLFCVWFKSFWREPLGFDGLVLAIVLTCIRYRAVPMIERLTNK